MARHEVNNKGTDGERRGLGTRGRASLRQFSYALGGLTSLLSGPTAPAFYFYYAFKSSVGQKA